ncbi:hypothetical protein EDB86DRAFT_3180714 [Lactarius hatsudake]|nr:hypothetical protein EDB86DRAFT_3180714 [Lactarius hatsudake]
MRVDLEVGEEERDENGKSGALMLGPDLEETLKSHKEKRDRTRRRGGIDNDIENAQPEAFIHPSWSLSTPAWLMWSYFAELVHHLGAHRNTFKCSTTTTLRAPPTTVTRDRAQPRARAQALPTRRRHAQELDRAQETHHAPDRQRHVGHRHAVATAQLYVGPHFDDNVATCGSTMQATSRAPNRETEPAACKPKSLTTTTPTLLLSGASHEFSNHGSHDDPAAAGTHTTPTRMKIPAIMEVVTVT